MNREDRDAKRRRIRLEQERRTRVNKELRAEGRGKLIRTCDNCKYILRGWSKDKCKLGYWGHGTYPSDEKSQRMQPNGCDDWKYARWRIFWDRILGR